tara:strand:- start:67 stop:480 length:414 start_codon:yes stop_codon:yes gene_type:complete
MNDDESVNHPAHYNQGTLETIEAIEGLNLEYHLGNVLKYIARWKYKDGIRDLRKAQWYLNRFVERAEGMEGTKEGGDFSGIPTEKERGARMKQWLRRMRDAGELTPEQAFNLYRDYHRDPSKHGAIRKKAVALMRGD